MVQLLKKGNGGITQSDLEKDLQRNPFSDWLPWVAYEPEDMAFLNVDETWGYMWECIPHTFATSREAKVIEGIISKTYPKGTSIQFMLYADDNIDGFLNEYERTKVRLNPVVKQSIGEFKKFFKSAKDGLGQLNGIPLRNHRLFFCIKSKDKLGHDLVSNIHDSLMGARLVPRQMDVGDLLAFTRGIFNRDTGENARHYSEYIPIRKQIIPSDKLVNWSPQNPEVTKIGDRYARCLTPKLLPESCDLLQANRLTGSIMGVEEDGDQINSPYLWCINILLEDAKAEILTKAQVMMAQRAVGTFSAKLKNRVEELSWALEEIERNDFVKIIPTLWVFGESVEKTRDATSRAKRIWETHGYTMQEENRLARPLFIASLPFGLYDVGKNISLLEREFPVPTKVAVRMIPIQADFRGTPSAVLAYAGRKGQVIGIDVFDKRSNNHNFLITAGSGAGKSFFMNNLCSNYYASGALVRLIDIGYSYKKLCSIYNGRYLDFGREHVCINPFQSMGKDEEDRESDLQATADVVSEMVYSASGQTMTETEWTLIKDAVRFAVKRDNGEMGIDHVYEYLLHYPKFVDNKDQKEVKQITVAAKVMGFNLQDYISGGRYGKFFNGKSTFNISNDEFVVLELEKLRSQKELFKVVTLQVANACTQDLYMSNRDRKRFILFEEAYQFLKAGNGAGNERIGRIIEEGYRRARKYGGSFGIVTQSLNDLASFGTSGSVIKTNSAYKFLLEADDYEEAVNKGVVTYEGLLLDLLISVKNNKPKYSEILFDTPLGVGIGRLIVERWGYWVNTSDADEVAKYEALLKKGATPYEAICKLTGI